MATGIGGSGPYGRIRWLRELIRASKYEIDLIEGGMKRPVSKKRHKQIIVESREEIRQLLKSVARQKATVSLAQVV